MNSIYRQLVESCSAHPTKIAIITEEREYSYQEFCADVENLANLLRVNYLDEEKGATIAVFMDRGYQLLVAIWAIIKVNGTYVPIDTTLNHQRIRYILDDSKATVILADDKNSETLVEIAGHLKRCVLQGELEEGTLSANVASTCLSGEYAYIIYTSGSTGQPKGILIDEQAFSSFLANFRLVLPGNSFGKILAQTSISFDISLVEVVYPFTVGKTVVICEKMQAWNIKTVLRIITTYAIDCLQITPSLLNLLLLGKDAAEKLQCVNTLLVGGEVFSLTLLQKAKEILKSKIYNLYGPTEATVWCTAAELTDAKEPMLGKAFGRNTVFLLDEQNVVIEEPGKPGELCIAGSQLASGYVERPELTDACFIKDLAIYGERFYKTGDRAQYDNPGNILYLGRRDNQIKIDGRRIELEDVEECIKELKWLADVVVSVVTAENSRFLRCYYVADQEYEVSALKLALKEYLPSYMIPKDFCRIDKIPLTSSGKKDRKALVSGNQ